MYHPDSHSLPRFASHSLLPVTVLGCALLFAACGDTTSEPPVDEVVKRRLAMVSGDGQFAPRDASLPDPLVVRVTDQANRPVAGVLIRWRQFEAGGFRGPAVPAVTTDQSGQASLTRRLGYYAGAYQTIAMVDGDSTESVFFTSIALVQNASRMRPADSASAAVADTVLSTREQRLLVLDHLDRPVPNVVVEWNTSSGSLLSGRTSTTDANGIARVSHTLGAAAGNHIVQAHVEGLLGSPVTFPILVGPGKPVVFEAVAGDGQHGRVLTAVKPYAVSVSDAYGNGHWDIPVSWSVTSGGGVLNRTTSATVERIAADIRPIATAIHTLGPNEDPQVVTATIPSLPGLAPVSFSTAAATAVVTMTEDTDYYCGYWGWCAPTFSPAQIQIPAGKSVLWVWGGGYFTHDVVFEDDPSSPVSAARKSSGTHVRTFIQPGTYRYRSTLHSTSFTDGMVGSVVVQ